MEDKAINIKKNSGELVEIRQGVIENSIIEEKAKLVEEMSLLELKYNELKGLIGNMVMSEYHGSINKVLEAEKEIAKLVERCRNYDAYVKEIKEQHKEEIERLKQGKLISKGIYDSDKNTLGIELAKYKGISTKLGVENNNLKIELEEKSMAIEILNGKLENREKEVCMLEGMVADLKDVIELVTGVKYDTEEIKDMLSNLTINIDSESLVVDYDILVSKLSNDGGLMVLTKEEATELVNIVKTNRNYLMKSTTGKVLVKNEEELIEKVGMIVRYINNGEVANKELADVYGISTQALHSRINTIKKSWFMVVKDYITAGEITDELIEKYGSSYGDIIDIIRERINTTSI